MASSTKTRDRRYIGDPRTTMWTEPNASSGNFRPTKTLLQRLLKAVGLKP